MCIRDSYSSFEEDIRALGEHFKNYQMIQRVEILPYHTLGAVSYTHLDVYKRQLLHIIYKKQRLQLLKSIPIYTYIQKVSRLSFKKNLEVFLYSED